MEKKKENISWLARQIRKFGNDLRYSRLNGTLSAYEYELESRILTGKNDQDRWVEKSRNLLSQCRQFMEERKIDEAWKCYHAARRLEVFGMTLEERKCLTKELREEAVKLKEWRQKALFILIGNKDSDTAAEIDPGVLNHALYIKDEHYDNVYYINRLTRRLFATLFLLLVMNIAAIILFTYIGVGCKNYSFNGKTPLLYELTGVLLFAFLGAITSTVIFTRNQAKLSRISELGTDRMIAFSKILVAGGFAVFIYFYLNSSIAESTNIFSFNLKSSFDYFLIAFISGFSERFVQKAIDALIGKDKDKSTKEDTLTINKTRIINDGSAEPVISSEKSGVTITEKTTI